MMNSNLEYLEKVIDNKNKARNWTLLWVSALTLLAIGLVYFIVQNKELKQNLDAEKLRSANMEMEKENQRISNELLQAQLDKYRADSAREVMEISQQNTSRLATNLSNQLDTMTKVVQEIKQQAQPISVPVTSTTGGSNSGASTDPSASITSTKLNAALKIQQANAALISALLKKPNATVYIQYMSKYAEKLDVVKSALSNYKIPPAEQVKLVTFNSSVRYFNDNDKALAQSVAEAVSKAIGETVPIQKSTLAAPSGQLELWLGKYEPRLPTMNLDAKKYNIN